MDYATMLRVLSAVSGGFFRILASMRESEQVEAYLEKKYCLTRKQEYHPSAYGGYYSMAKDESWSLAMAGVIGKIVSSNQIDEHLCTLCGDLLMFTSIFDYQFADTQTYGSVMEMARGRGTPISLKIIQSEIKLRFAWAL